MGIAARGRFGLLSFFICSVVALVPGGVVDGWRAAPLLAIWAAGAGVRWYHGDRQILTDCVVFGVWNAILARAELKGLVTRGLDGLDPVRSWVVACCVAVPLASVAYLARRESGTHDRTPEELKGLTLSKWDVPYPKAKIFPCQTKHARMFPKRHAFEYSYLQCGFPIIPAGVRPDGTALGSGDAQLGCWWMSIRAEDYLNRGNGSLGFYNKLKLYLRDQNVDDADWSYAYLITAPRFFGYSFNPVSFWYIYDSEHQLTKMILEVNNTFGERRMYLLDGSNVVPSTPQSTDSEASSPDLPLGAKSRFNDIWMKDFHVSPFNSRKGSYVLRAQNPFPYATYDTPVVDNTITLISSKDHAKLVARLNSTGPALDQDHMSVSDTLRFVLSWWWVGFVTFPRIVKEAGLLFFKRSLHVWFRPEVLHTGVGRLPTAIEATLCDVFEEHLFQLIHRSQEPFHITLHTAIPDSPIREIITTYIQGRDIPLRKLEIRVLTPAFYSRFVHYAYTSEAFDRECIFTDEKNRTLWISRPELLPLLFNRRTPSEPHQSFKNRTYLDEMRWKLLRRLRCPPAAPAYAASTPSKAEFTTEDVRSLPFSEMDQFMRSSPARIGSRQYRKIVTKLFLAQRFGFGFAEVLGLMDVIVRVLLCWLGALQLATLRTQSQNAGIDGCSTKMFRDCSRDVEYGYVEWWWFVGTMLATSACHGYGLLKG
ncbi:hypothetical protein HBH98_002460 [Parastagonospora nodorum]|nr:hypothetical protein HBH53_175300 [Parastagonospora nodorum]KAH3996732.1 hypothetical protein HBI10_151970 [Parastagonospora nodorum]KAH4012463.1 hypothetical protein HBI13_186660 [Parastagonospora nodorum]KAH4116616.1 hypothetical protein HBH47_164630 [Parastagonospora nodorum]KAH4198195.1 hypothetical protein HBI95_185710 [Parastagonospora nodorum]